MSKKLEICVHQAADTIGGNCIEIRSKNGSRLILDAGRPLELTGNIKSPIPTSLDINKKVAGVLISHAHKDHYGMLESIPEDWAVYCGKISQRLMEFNSSFMGKKLNNNFKIIEREIQIEDFKITAYLVDHSIIDARAFLIEVDGKKILYTGDFRTHGRNKDLHESFIKSLPTEIDILLIEGTNLIDLEDCASIAKATIEETSLEEAFFNVFNDEYKRIFLTCSSQNFDRIISIYNAAERAGRRLVIDLFTSYVLHILSEYDSSIPNPLHAKYMRTVVTYKMNNVIKAKVGEEVKNNYIKLLKEERRAYSVDTLSKWEKKPIIMVRDSLVEPYTYDDNGKTPIIPTNEDLWIWSMWDGYKKDSSTLKTREYLKPCIEKYIHTSGHASKESLLELTNRVQAKKIIPIHGENWQKHKDSFENIFIVSNGQWEEI